MSESPNADARRRERVRRVDALTAASRQPGEGPRLGTRIAGAVAVVALAAGATLGIGAWHSYNTETAAKEAKEQQAQKRQQAAATRRVKEPNSPSDSESKKEPRESAEGRQRPKAGEVEKPKKTVRKPESDVKLNERTKKAGAGYSRVVLANKASNMCADLPGFQGHPGGGPIQQYPCNASDADNQLWNISVSHPGAGAENGDLVMLANQKDNLCFDLPDAGGKPAGTHVMESPCNDAMDDNQQWRIENLPDGSKKIHNYASRGKCLQTAGNSNKSDGPLVIGPCDAPSSDWYIRQ